MNDKEVKKNFSEISKRIGHKIGTYCNDKEIEVFEKFLEDYKYKSNLIEKQKEEIETLKRDFETVDHECNRLEQEDIRKDMIINEMTEELVKAHEWFYSKFDNYTKEDFIKYFEKKAEEE